VSRTIVNGGGKGFSGLGRGNFLGVPKWEAVLCSPFSENSKNN
jgi:hypothetical protein